MTDMNSLVAITLAIAIVCSTIPSSVSTYSSEGSSSGQDYRPDYSTSYFGRGGGGDRDDFNPRRSQKAGPYVNPFNFGGQSFSHGGDDGRGPYPGPRPLPRPPVVGPRFSIDPPIIVNPQPPVYGYPYGPVPYPEYPSYPSPRLPKVPAGPGRYPVGPIHPPQKPYGSDTQSKPYPEYPSYPDPRLPNVPVGPGPFPAGPIHPPTKPHVSGPHVDPYPRYPPYYPPQKPVVHGPYLPEPVSPPKPVQVYPPNPVYPTKPVEPKPYPDTYQPKKPAVPGPYPVGPGPVQVYPPKPVVRVYPTKPADPKPYPDGPVYPQPYRPKKPVVHGPYPTEPDYPPKPIVPVYPPKPVVPVYPPKPVVPVYPPKPIEPKPYPPTYHPKTPVGPGTYPVGPGPVVPKPVPRPTQPAKPALPLSLCDNCKFKNGVGYNPFPNDCNAYVTCQRLDSYKLIPKKQRCPYNLFWSQRLLTCVRPKDTKCPFDRCLVTKGKTAPVAGNCAAYHVCDSYYRTSAIFCCAYGYRYQAGYGYGKPGHVPCVRDPSCLDSCAPKKTPFKKEPCRLFPASDPRKYQEKVFGKFMVRDCAPGTAFVHKDCGCTARVKVPKKVGCFPEVFIDFKLGIRDVSGNFISIGNEWDRVKSVKSSLARDGFAGQFYNGQLILWRFSNAPLGPPLKIVLTFLEKPFQKGGYSGKNEILVSNGDCGKPASVSITFDRASRTVTALVNTKSTYIRDYKPAFVTVPYAAGEFKEVVYSYDGKYLTLSVKSKSSQKTKSVQVFGKVLVNQCALSIGGVKGGTPFYGLLDDFKLFLCAPKPVVPYPAPGPVYPAPGPVYPAPGPVYPLPGPVYPAPKPIYPAPGPVYPAPAPGPVYPAPGPVHPAPKPFYPTGKQVYSV